jgi:hypothetical protein
MNGDTQDKRDHYINPELVALRQAQDERTINLSPIPVRPEREAVEGSDRSSLQQAQDERTINLSPIPVRPEREAVEGSDRSSLQQA